MPQPANQRFYMEFQVIGEARDTIFFKMHYWMTGCSQLMNYSGCVENISTSQLSAEF